MFEVLYTVVGVVIGVVVYYARLLYSRRDIVEYTLKFWVEAWKDGKVTVEEVFSFIKGLIDMLGLSDRIVVEKRE